MTWLPRVVVPKAGVPKAGAPNEDAPLSDAEADTCLGQLLLGEAGQGLLLAVSGGVDSMVLMHLAVEVRLRLGHEARLMVATVDHRLRSESADEAAFVAQLAARLGLDHETLVWGDARPTASIAAASRFARYGLLAAACRRNHAHAVVTAHTRDDQAETFLMRLARGSGVDGLSAMSPTSVLMTAAGALVVRRPFLEVSKGRLMATAEARGIPWREDPGNSNDLSERVRMRKALVVLEGLGISGAAMARSARRLQGARDVVLADTLRVLADPERVILHNLGFATLTGASWTSEPREIRLRVLAALVRHVGGVDDFLSRAKLEEIEASVTSCMSEDMSGRKSTGPGRAAYVATYACVKFIVTGNCLRMQREPGRPPAVVEIAPGETLLWDNRFWVTRLAAASPEMTRRITVRHLGPDGLKRLRDVGCSPETTLPEKVTADILHTVPAFWSGDTLISVPALAALCAGPEIGPEIGPTPVDDVGCMWFHPRSELIARESRKRGVE